MNTTTPPFFLVSRIHSFAKLKSTYLLNQAFVDPSILILDDLKLPPNDQRKLTERRSREECIRASPVHRCVLEEYQKTYEHRDLITPFNFLLYSFSLSLVDVELQPGENVSIAEDDTWSRRAAANRLFLDRRDTISKYHHVPSLPHIPSVFHDTVLRNFWNAIAFCRVFAVVECVGNYIGSVVRTR